LINFATVLLDYPDEKVVSRKIQVKRFLGKKL